MRTAFSTNTNYNSGLGIGILSTYPQIGAQAGLHGLFVYALAGAVPFILFGLLGPIIRKQMPEAFVLTEWIRYRYGVIASLVVSCCTILTLFLFMVSELASLKACVETISNVPGLPVIIVQAVLVSLYTSMGGFYVSFLTDNLQVFTFLTLLVVCVIGVGCSVHIDKSLVGPSHLLNQSKLGWKLIYVLTMAIVTNDCFMAGFWLRTFAAKTKRDLQIACLLTGFLLFVLCSTLGTSGILAVWSGLLDPASPEFEHNAQTGFFILIKSLPSWISGFVLVFVAMLSACTFDSLQSAMVSSISNDFFRNRVRIQWIRLLVLGVLAPVVLVSLKATNVLSIYLIVDVLSSCIVPVLFLGLSKHFWFVNGFDVVLALIGGILGTYIFGTVYYKSASAGGSLLIMQKGLYGDDWGAFGAFIAAPVSSVLSCVLSIVLRGIMLAIYERRLFAVFDKPPNGEHFFPPADAHLFALPKPWYEYTFKHKFFKRVDYWIFVQNSNDMAQMLGGSVLPEPAHHRSASDASSSAKIASFKEGLSGTFR